MTRRLLCIWLPRLASDVALRRHPVAGAFALTLRAANAEHLHCLNPAAQARGLVRGMPLADARAICPDLATRPADLAAEAAALAALCRWAGRYGPVVAADGPDGLVADISGVAHLFGGEAALRADATRRLARAGITAVAAIAGTRGAAHALARHGGGGIVPDGGLHAALAPLPVTALRIDDDTAQALARLGLTSIGALAATPRAPLARRFGLALVQRLDQALGDQAEPVGAAPDRPHFGVRMTLPEPIGLQADVMAGLGRLLDRLCDHLARHRMGARRLRLDLRRVDRATAQVEIGTARPMRDPARLAALFARGVEAVDAGFGIDALRLTAPVVEPLEFAQLGAAEALAEVRAGHDPVPAPPAGRQDDALADLIAALGNRLGFDRVLRLVPAESLIPERSVLTVPAAYAPAQAAAPSPDPRPILIFPPEAAQGVEGRPPQRLVWRRRALTVQAARGPERILPEWWLDDPAWRSGPRDYWRVETAEGPRLWLFHTPLAPAWWVQGEFA